MRLCVPCVREACWNNARISFGRELCNYFPHCFNSICNRKRKYKKRNMKMKVRLSLTHICACNGKWFWSSKKRLKSKKKLWSFSALMLEFSKLWCVKLLMEMNRASESRLVHEAWVWLACVSLFPLICCWSRLLCDIYIERIYTVHPI